MKYHQSSQSFSALFSRLNILGPAIGLSLFGANAYCEPAEIFLTQLVQEYDGTSKSPVVVSEPPGLVELQIVPRSQSETVFQTIPDVLDPAYQSFGFNGSTAAELALGDLVNLGGTNRFLESIDVTMVNWSKAAGWPVLAGENPEGFMHPLTIRILQYVDGVNPELWPLLAEKTQSVLIPWRPATLDDGGEYPFGGFAFTTRFNFNEEIELPGRIAIMVAYNTERRGLDPIGVRGPYNSLNVGLLDKAPIVGTDESPIKVLRYVAADDPLDDDSFGHSGKFGRLAPMFRVRTFSANPSTGTPVDAGGYRIRANVTEEGFEGAASADFQIRPLEAEVSFLGLRQVADGTAKTVSVETVPPGLTGDLVFSRRTSPPTARGLYPVFFTLDSPNYVGRASAMMRLGYSYDSWIAEKVSSGSVDPGLAEAGDDPDEDGRSNFKEYLAGTNPGLIDDSFPPLLEMMPVLGGLDFSFLRNNEAADLKYALQVTRDLSDPLAWSDFPGSQDVGDSFTPLQDLTFSSTFQPSVPSEYFRLKVERLTE